ncbi:MAG TPA: VCBS repeat-containing protein, partial [Pyrinomonadaceae bacterium]
MKLKLQFIIAAIIVLAIYIPVVHGQANLTFSGANGTPLTITLQQSVTYTINNPNCTNGPIFVFDGAGSFPSVGGDQVVSGTMSFSINGGSAQLINKTGSNSSAGVLTPNDIYALRNPLVPISNGDVVVLNAGSYTTANNISGPPPANGSFPTFITNAGLAAGCSANGVSSLPSTAPFDFDGDNKSDFSIFRPSNGEWWYLRSSDGGNNASQFGTSTDVMTPGDYTGDGKWDFAFYRPSNGTWYILRSEDGSYYAFPFGLGT